MYKSAGSISQMAKSGFVLICSIFHLHTDIDTVENVDTNVIFNVNELISAFLQASLNYGTLSVNMESHQVSSC